MAHRIKIKKVEGFGWKLVDRKTDTHIGYLKGRPPAGSAVWNDVLVEGHWFHEVKHEVSEAPPSVKHHYSVAFDTKKMAAEMRDHLQGKDK